MSLVYVFAATKMESQAVERLIGVKPDSASRAPVKAGQCGSNEVVLFTTGMGPRRARARAAAAFGWEIPQTGPAGRPDAAVVIGLCGGLSPSLVEGTIVSYTKCLSTENSQGPLSCSPSLVDQQVALLASKGVPCERVVGITSPRVGTPLGEKLTLAKLAAGVVDMESYEILAAATQAGVPITVLRIVADSVDQKMPDFNRALKSDGDFDGWRALKVALGSPLLTAKLIGANRRAIRKLTPALEVLLASDCFTDTRGPALPSRRGKLVREDWRRYPALAVALGLLRKTTYSLLGMGHAFLAVVPDEERRSFADSAANIAKKTYVNPLLLGLQQKLLLLFCFVRSDGSILQPLYEQLLQRVGPFAAAAWAERNAGHPRRVGQ